MRGVKIYAKIKDALTNAISLGRKSQSKKRHDITCLECESRVFEEREITISERFYNVWGCTQCTFEVMDSDQMNKLLFDTNKNYEKK